MIPIHLLLIALIGFISTNIDDIFLLTILFSQVGPNLKTKEIIMGQYLGLGILVLISMGVGLGLSAFLSDQLHLLGLIPIMVGIKVWIDYRKNEGSETVGFSFAARRSNKEEGSIWTRFLESPILRVALLIFAGGADNIGIYVPLFSRFTVIELVMVILVFMILVPIWCVLAYKIASNVLIKKNIEKYERMLIPLVFIVLGLLILFD